MPRAKKIDTEVDATTNSTNPAIPVVLNSDIAPLHLDLGRADLNNLVEKVNEIIKKVNNL